MGITISRAAGIKAGETVLTEEQIKTGYEVDPKAVTPGTFKVAEQDKTGYETDIILPTGLNFVRYDAIAIGDDYGALRDLAHEFYGIMLHAYDAAVAFKISYNNILWSSDMRVQKHNILGFDVRVRYWRAKRNVAGEGVYAIVYAQGKI